MITARTADRSCPQCGAELKWPGYADVIVCGSCGSTLAADAGLRALQCPQCAGALAAIGGRRLLGCCHCGVQVFVSAKGGYDRWRLPLRADCAEAEQVAREWLQQYPGVAQPAHSARFCHRELVYTSVWEYSALVAGWELGSATRIRTETIGSGEAERLELRTVSETVHDAHFQERHFYLPAADLASIGGNRPRISGKEPLLPLVAGDLEMARVEERSGSAEEMLTDGRRIVTCPTSAARHPDSHIFALRESVSLLFYPFWVLDYQVDDCSYSVVVNAYEARVHSAVAPAGAIERLREKLSTLFDETHARGMVEYHDAL